MEQDSNPRVMIHGTFSNRWRNSVVLCLESNKIMSEFSLKPVTSSWRKHAKAILCHWYALDPKRRVFAKEKNQIVTLAQNDLKPSILFDLCEGCTYTIEGVVSKVFLTECKDCEIIFNGRIRTQAIDVWNCSNVKLKVRVCCWGILRLCIVYGNICARVPIVLLIDCYSVVHKLLEKSYIRNCNQNSVV